MPTPDPIALPELPEPVNASYRDEGSSRSPWSPNTRFYTADQMRAYGQACVDAAHPIPADMVLVPRRATPEMLADFWYTATGSTGGGFWLTKRQLARARKAYAAMLAAAPPLNELLGHPEQLASLEQRARHVEVLRAIGSAFEGIPSPCEERGAVDAAIAALSAQVRDEYADCCNTPSYCSSVRRCTRQDAAPQPREDVTCKGPCTPNDFFNGKACDNCIANRYSPPWREVQSDTSWHECPHCKGWSRTTTPQDAAGVEAPAEPPKVDDDVVVKLLRESLLPNERRAYDDVTFERSPPLFPQATYDVPTIGMSRFAQALVDHYVKTTPPPGVDVGKLEADARDAARYRWLKAGGYEHADDGLPHIVVHRQNDWGNWYDQIIEDDEADAAIDAAEPGTGKDSLQVGASTELWCLHVQGPDDVHAAPSREAAELVARRINAYFSSLDTDVNPNAVAALWPHSPESHAESLKEWEQVWTTQPDAAPGVGNG